MYSGANFTVLTQIYVNLLTLSDVKIPENALNVRILRQLTSKIKNPIIFHILSLLRVKSKLCKITVFTLYMSRVLALISQ